MTKQPNKQTDWKQQIKEGVSQLRSSEGWMNYLKTQSMFTQYSFGNCILIAKQRPSATKVAGYKTWQAMNRQVRKGAKSIKVLAPMKKKTDDPDQDVFFFRAVSVFDVADTFGDDLPKLHLDCITADNPTSLTWRLEKFVADYGCDLKYQGDTGFALGWYHPLKHEIVINNALSHERTATTLAHEIAHSILHCRDQKLDAERHKTSFKELEAESVAYIVCSHFGFQMGNSSFGYILEYNKDSKDFEKNLELSGKRISDCARRIISAVKDM